MRKLITAFCLVLMGGVAFAADLAPELIACRAISDDAERLACYDAIARAAETKPAAATTPVAEAAPAPEATFGKSAVEIRREQEARSSEEEITRIEATVTNLRKMGNHKLEIALDNGQIWRQISSSSLRLKEGDNIVIKRAALGSYRLVKVGNKRAMQVRRAK